MPRNYGKTFHEIFLTKFGVMFKIYHNYNVCNPDMLIFRGAIYYSFVDVIPGPSRFECISTEKPNGMDFLSYPDICW